MKISFTRICSTRDDAIVQAGAAKRDNYKVLIIGPVNIVRYGNKAGAQTDSPNPNNPEVWLVVATDSTVDTSLL